MRGTRPARCPTTSAFSPSPRTPTLSRRERGTACRIGADAIFQAAGPTGLPAYGFLIAAGVFSVYNGARFASFLAVGGIAGELDMSEPEGEKPIFEDLTFPADELTFAEAEEPAAAPSEPAAGSQPPEAHAEAVAAAPGEGLAPSAADAAAAEPAEAEEAPAEEAPEAEAAAEAEEATPEKKKAKVAVGYLDWIVVAAVSVVICLLLFLLHAPYAIWHASYLIVMIAMAFYLWKSRKIWTKFEVTALYTVVLAGTAAALLTGVYCLGLALCSPYHWDLGAKLGKQQAKQAKTQSVVSAPAHTPGK